MRWWCQNCIADADSSNGKLRTSKLYCTQFCIIFKNCQRATTLCIGHIITDRQPKCALNKSAKFEASYSCSTLNLKSKVLQKWQLNRWLYNSGHIIFIANLKVVRWSSNKIPFSIWKKKFCLQKLLQRFSKQKIDFTIGHEAQKSCLLFCFETSRKSSSFGASSITDGQPKCGLSKSATFWQHLKLPKVVHQNHDFCRVLKFFALFSVRD